MAERRVVHRELEGRGVGALEHDRVWRQVCDHGVDVLGGQRADLGVDVDVGGPATQRPCGGLGLGATDVGDAVEHLAVQVGGLDPVGIDDRQTPSPGGTEPEQRGATQATSAHDHEVDVLEQGEGGHRRKLRRVVAVTRPRGRASRRR